MNWFKNVFCVGAFVLSATPVLPQTLDRSIEPSPAVWIGVAAPTLDEIRFAGLRRISPAAVAAQITSHAGDRFDLLMIEKDVRTLALLGWFESIEVEEAPAMTSALPMLENESHVALIFHFEERPFLSKVEYSSSKLLSQKQIEKILEDKKLAPRLSKPADPAALQRIAFAIRAALNELGHSEAGVRIDRKEANNATVAVRFGRGNRWPRGAVKMPLLATGLNATVNGFSRTTRTMAFRKRESVTRKSLRSTNRHADGFPGRMNRP